MCLDADDLVVKEYAAPVKDNPTKSIDKQQFICQECGNKYEKYGSLVNHLEQNKTFLKKRIFLIVINVTNYLIL